MTKTVDHVQTIAALEAEAEHLDRVLMAYRGVQPIDRTLWDRYGGYRETMHQKVRAASRYWQIQSEIALLTAEQLEPRLAEADREFAANGKRMSERIETAEAAVAALSQDLAAARDEAKRALSELTRLQERRARLRDEIVRQRSLASQADAKRAKELALDPLAERVS